MRKLCCVIATFLVLSLVAPTLAQQVTVTVEPQREADDTLTGRYVARVTFAGNGAARQVVFRLDFPTEYALDTTPSDIQIVAVAPGEDALSIDADDPPDGTAETPVVFAEAIDADPVNGIWVVALMKDDAQKDPKHVCDIVFTAKGRATTTPLTFQANSITVKDGALADLNAQGSFATAQNPWLGDLDWDGDIGFSDFNLWLLCWQSKENRPMADLDPLLTGEATDPANAVSEGDDAITFGDFNAWLVAWQNK